MAKSKKEKNTAGNEEHLLMLSLMSPHVSSKNVLDALTTDQGPNDLFSLLFFKRDDVKSIELIPTWAVSDEIQLLATKTSLFLCDLNDQEIMTSLMYYLCNIPNIVSDSSGLEKGVPEAPSIIIIVPSQRRLLYAEYGCKVTSLPTILMIVEDFQSYDERIGTTHNVLSEASQEEEQSIDGENYFDFESTPPPTFAVLENSEERERRPTRATDAQLEEIEAMRRIQERQEIEDEYMQALAADRKIAAEEEFKRQAAEVDAERERQEMERQRIIKSEKDRIQSQIRARAPSSAGVRICLRARSGEKIIFALPIDESLQTVLEMAYATDPTATEVSHVLLCTTAPRRSYGMHLCPMPTIGDIANGHPSIALIVEVSTLSP